MNIVVTVDENWAVGRQDKLLVQIPADQRNFQRLTMGGTVVMGRKTLQAMPQGQPLYGRNNIILSENRDFKVRGTQVLHSLEELYDKIKNISDEDIYCLLYTSPSPRDS